MIAWILSKLFPPKLKTLGRVVVDFGAGDQNRTGVKSLEDSRPATGRRPPLWGHRSESN